MEAKGLAKVHTEEACMQETVGCCGVEVTALHATHTLLMCEGVHHMGHRMLHPISREV